MGGPDALGDLSVTMVSDRSFVYPALHSFLLGKFRVLSFDYSPLFIFLFLVPLVPCYFGGILDLVDWYFVELKMTTGGVTLLYRDRRWVAVFKWGFI